MPDGDPLDPLGAVVELEPPQDTIRAAIPVRAIARLNGALWRASWRCVIGASCKLALSPPSNVAAPPGAARISLPARRSDLIRPDPNPQLQREAHTQSRRQLRLHH